MKELEAGFAQVEKQVRALVEANAALRTRVAELEQELAQARRESEGLRGFHVKRLHIREKVENVLAALEAMGKQGS